jgi:putative solute:sodium symporter small subunit
MLVFTAMLRVRRGPRVPPGSQQGQANAQYRAMQPRSSSAEPSPLDALAPDLDGLDTQLWRRRTRITVGLLGVWLLVTFGVAYFARELSIVVWGWPLSFWVAAQGALLVYMGLVVAYERRMGRIDDERDAATRTGG